jgi:hypothetical protein
VYTTVPYVQVQRKKIHNTLIFHGKKFKNPCPTPKMEYRHLSVVCDRFFNIFPVTAPTCDGRLIRPNLNMGHIVMTGTHKSFIAYKELSLLE